MCFTGHAFPSWVGRKDRAEVVYKISSFKSSPTEAGVSIYVYAEPLSLAFLLFFEYRYIEASLIYRRYVGTSLCTLNIHFSIQSFHGSNLHAPLFSKRA